MLSQQHICNQISRILIVGQAGVGKSSLINLLADKIVAKENDGAHGCTFEFNMYTIQHEDVTFHITDTPGLNETTSGTVPHEQALSMLVEFIEQHKYGFNCILCVMKKGRITNNFEMNYKFFSERLLGRSLPTILYVGFCEEDEPITKWFDTPENAQILKNNYEFVDVICGTTKHGGRQDRLLKPLRDETRTNLWASIKCHMKTMSIPMMNSTMMLVSIFFTKLKYRARQSLNKKRNNDIMNDDFQLIECILNFDASMENSILFEEKNVKVITFFEQIASELGLEKNATINKTMNKYFEKDTLPIKRSILKEIAIKGYINRVLIIGQAGVGKSSLVNLLTGRKHAATSDSAIGCTFEYTDYKAEYKGVNFELIDTVGLNESSKGKVPRKMALKNLIRFIRNNKRGFNCVIVVMKKGRVDMAFEENHTLFCKNLLKQQIPVVLYVGYCEEDDPLNAWIKKPDNYSALKRYSFSDIVCGTTKEGGRFVKELEPLRCETYDTLWTSINKKMLDKPQAIEPNFNLFQSVWNSVCDFWGFDWKYVTDTFEDFLNQLKRMGFNENEVHEINKALH